MAVVRHKQQVLALVVQQRVVAVRVGMQVMEALVVVIQGYSQAQH